MKIIFVNPPYQEWVKSLPLGIAYLSAFLREKGYQVKIIDANAEELTTQKVLERIRSDGFDMVCVTSATVQIYQAWNILRAVKDYNPRIVTVIGGVHPSALPEESLAKEFIDFVVRGEGEITLWELIRTLKDGGQLKDITGLSYKLEDRFQHNLNRPLINNLDSLPFPARDLFPFPYKYSSPFKLKRYHATLITSRGCPGGCIFCNKNIFGSTFRARSPENILEEMIYLKKSFKIEEFHMADDCFSWDRERVEKICDLLIKRKVNVRWACSNGIRVDTVDIDLLRHMKEAGCYRISFGVESGSNEVLRKIGKRIDLDKVKESFNMTQEVGMITVAFFMLGNAGENRDTMEKTINFAKHLKTDYAQFTITTPFPGTIFYRLVEKKGRFLSSNWEEFGVYSKPLFELNGLTADLMDEMYRKAYREFYFRPRQIFFILCKRLRYLSIVDLTRIFNSFKEILKRIFKNLE